VWIFLRRLAQVSQKILLVQWLNQRLLRHLIAQNAYEFFQFLQLVLI
jgi:hypothetical protein